MKKIKIKKIFKQLIIFGTIPFILSGCKSTKCDINDTHLHKYVGSTQHGMIENYYLEERDDIYEEHSSLFDVNLNGITYHKQNETILVTADELAFYKAKGQLFHGKDNWDFLFNIMAYNHDYIKYEYRYKDDDGRIHHRWTENQNHIRLTGDIRVYHFRYYGYKIEKIDGKYVKIQSPLVDDIRDIINEYPYFNLQCFKEVYKEYNFDSNKAKNLKLNDVDEFEQPNLSTRELNINRK